MFRYRVRTKSPAEMQKKFQRSKIPGWNILQGLFLVIIGIAFIASNAAGSPYKEITGHITSGYTHTINGVYDATYLQINTDPNEFFIFDKNTLTPAWATPVLHARVDIYYSDGTPKHVVAIQTYDVYGDPTTRYTTSEYLNYQQQSPVSNIGLDVGVILIALGVLWSGNAIFKLVKKRRQQHIPASAGR
jgi:hypothetical protein